MSIKFKLNGEIQTIETADQDMPLLWYLREEAGLKGTKFGCGIGECGACTVHFNGQAIRSCLLPIKHVDNADVVTIEGLSGNNNQLHPVQQAWIDIDVPQCGYCQSGQIMATVALLAQNPNPTDADIEQNITNICRCGTYVRIRKAIHLAAKK